MNWNWRAAAMGGVAFWIVSLILGYMGGLAGWGNVIAALIGGFVGAWQARDRNPQMGGMTGALAGVIGGVIAIILTYAGLSYGSWPIALGNAWLEWIVWGLVFGAIGGAVSAMMKR